MRCALLLFLAVSLAGAQEFEVASVRVTATASTSDAARRAAKGGAGSADPGQFVRRNATLASLIVNAYSLKPYQLIGPAWLSSDRYDITAKVPEGTDRDQQSVMLQHLLAARFGLKCHRESRQMPLYELTVGKGGPKIKPANEPEPPPTGTPKITTDSDGWPTLPPGIKSAVVGRNGANVIVFRDQYTMEDLAARLSGQADHPVIDRTGLQGRYDVAIHWVLDAPAVPGAAAADPGPSLYEAVQTQLGLKLDPKKGAIEVLVVDHAEKTPTEN